MSQRSSHPLPSGQLTPQARLPTRRSWPSARQIGSPVLDTRLALGEEILT